MKLASLILRAGFLFRRDIWEYLILTIGWIQVSKSEKRYVCWTAKGRVDGNGGTSKCGWKEEDVDTIAARCLMGVPFVEPE